MLNEQYAAMCKHSVMNTCLCTGMTMLIRSYHGGEYMFFGKELLHKSYIWKYIVYEGYEGNKHNLVSKISSLILLHTRNSRQITSFTVHSCSHGIGHPVPVTNEASPAITNPSL